MLSVFGGGGVFDAGLSTGKEWPGAGLAAGAGVILIRFPSGWAPGGVEGATDSDGPLAWCSGGCAVSFGIDGEREGAVDDSAEGVWEVPSACGVDGVVPSFARRLLRIYGGVSIGETILSA